MGPWSFPILAEARMAERLLEVERERLARSVATTRARGRNGRTRPHSSPSGKGHLLAGALGIALAGCLLLGGAVVGGTAETQAAGRPASVPYHVLAATSTIAHAGHLLFGWALVGSWLDPLNGDPAGCTGLILEGEAPELHTGPCGVPTFGWVPGTAAPLLDATLLRPPVLLPVCPLP